MNQCGDNDIHMIAFVDPERRDEVMRTHKNFRKFNTKNTDRFFHVKYWFTSDKALAEKLKIDTSLEGNIYSLRPHSVYTFEKPNVKICDGGYDYHSKKILSGDEIKSDTTAGSQSYARILE